MRESTYGRFAGPGKADEWEGPLSGKISRIAITTGGGDAPGLNAVIRAVVLASLRHDWECYGIFDGYDGLLFPDRYPEEGLCRLTRTEVRGITHLGGTIIGTTNHGNPFSYALPDESGELVERDVSDRLVDAFQARNLDALVAIGGDGSMTIAHGLSLKGIPLVGVPKTIDNDLDQTVVTFGFDTAVAFATECIGRLHTTAEAHDRVIVVEVMGRYAGWIALYSGIAGGADAILIPEIPYVLESVARKIDERRSLGRDFSIIVAAEGAAPRDGERTVAEKTVGKAEKLGGIGDKVAAELAQLTGKETRCVVLGHLLRGGSPTAHDRLIALRFGAAAVRALEAGKFGNMVALDPPRIQCVPLESATRRMKTVPLDGDQVATARLLGICLGEDED